MHEEERIKCESFSLQRSWKDKQPKSSRQRSFWVSHCPSTCRSQLQRRVGIDSSPKGLGFGRRLYVLPVYCILFQDSENRSCDKKKLKSMLACITTWIRCVLTRSSTFSVRITAPAASSANATANTSDWTLQRNRSETKCNWTVLFF